VNDPVGITVAPSQLSRLERLLPYACLASAAVLLASQLLTMFEFTPPGAEALGSRSVIDHHGPALIVLAACAVFGVVLAVWGASKPGSIAVAVIGGVSLLMFLLIDLPDAGQVGTFDDARQSFFDAEAVPQAGFWLEMIGALGLAITGGALASYTPDQLAALRPGSTGEKTAQVKPIDGRPAAQAANSEFRQTGEASKTEQIK